MTELIATTPMRVRVFVDFWNFQIKLKEWDSSLKLDWAKLGPWLTTKAGTQLAAAGHSNGTQYEGLHVYLSHDPNKSTDDGLRRWANNTLDRFPGVTVNLRERKWKNPPKCPVCHTPVSLCPHCAAGMTGTVEKGIDTAIVTDMIRLAWEESYDLAVLVSADRDFVPAVEFLNSKGRKIIQAGFPPDGSELARKCWASINLPASLRELART